MLRSSSAWLSTRRSVTAASRRRSPRAWTASGRARWGQRALPRRRCSARRSRHGARSSTAWRPSASRHCTSARKPPRTGSSARSAKWRPGPRSTGRTSCQTRSACVRGRRSSRGKRSSSASCRMPSARLAEREHSLERREEEAGRASPTRRRRRRCPRRLGAPSWTASSPARLRLSLDRAHFEVELAP